MKSLAKIQNRQGRCYELAIKAMLDEQGAERFTLVHGSVFSRLVGRQIRHAWIEVGDGCIYAIDEDTYEPADQYMTRCRAVAHYRYSQLEASRLVAVTGHSGPWTNEERRDIKHKAKGWRQHAAHGSGVMLWRWLVITEEPLSGAARPEPTACLVAPNGSHLRL
jgi:hypothetical protein